MEAGAKAEAADKREAKMTSFMVYSLYGKLGQGVSGLDKYTNTHISVRHSGTSEVSLHVVVEQKDRFLINKEVHARVFSASV